MTDSGKALIVDWQSWLQQRGLVRADNIVISEVPVSFFFLDIFLPALSMLPKEGRLFLLFDAPFIDVGYATALIDRVKNYGFSVDSSKSSDYVLCFICHGGSEFDGVWFSGSGFFVDELRGLFSKVFKSDISEAYWNWKYPKSLENYSVVGFKGKDLVAHYGISQRLLYAKTELIKSAQVGDVMVDESCRGGIKGSIFSGLFYYTTAPLPSVNEGLESSSRPLVGFGFPHGRHMKLGVRLGVYKNAGKLHRVDIQPLDESKQQKTFLKNDKSTLRTSWIAGWAKMLKSSSELCVLDRSWSYCLKRYCHHPEKSYDFYIGNDCVFVLSTGNKVPNIIDYVGELSSFIAEARALARFMGVNNIEAWLTDWQMDYFSHTSGFTSKDSSAAFAIMYNGDGYFSKYESAAWWISMGDADFT